jgi:signal transduction histidine kinase
VAHDGTGACSLHVSVAEHLHGNILDTPTAVAAQSKADSGGDGVTQQKGGPCVCFSVQDNGCGIEEEELGRVFEAFHQLKAGTAYKGMYVVLSMCYD